MIEYDRIDLSEVIDVNKTNVSKKCDIWHYWYFLDKGFKFQPFVWNMFVSFDDADINSVKGSDYRIHFWYMSRDYDPSIMKNSDLNENVIYYFFSCLDIIKIEYLLSKNK